MIGRVVAYFWKCKRSTRTAGESGRRVVVVVKTTEKLVILSRAAIIPVQELVPALYVAGPSIVLAFGELNSVCRRFWRPSLLSRNANGTMERERSSIRPVPRDHGTSIVNVNVNTIRPRPERSIRRRRIDL